MSVSKTTAPSVLLFDLFIPSAASDRGRDKNGKLRPKSEGFELYNNSVQNGSPESPQAGWDSYPEPKKMSGEDRLLKNRADHRSSPNVASKMFPSAAEIVLHLSLAFSAMSSFCSSRFDQLDKFNFETFPYIPWGLLSFTV